MGGDPGWVDAVDCPSHVGKRTADAEIVESVAANDDVAGRQLPDHFLDLLWVLVHLLLGEKERVGSEQVAVELEDLDLWVGR